MQNPLNDLLTRDEQKLLLGFCAVFALGMALMLGGWSPMQASSNSENTQNLLKAVEKDHVVKIDIRIASKEELMQLKGIGAKRADDILLFRLQKPFTSVYDLKQISGIGEKTFQNILPSLILFGADSTKAVNAESSIKRPAAESKTKPDKNTLININTATLEELITLDGIGEVKARAIIDFRKESGGFGSIDDFTKVKGIGAKTLEKNRSRLRI